MSIRQLEPNSHHQAPVNTLTALRAANYAAWSDVIDVGPLTDVATGRLYSLYALDNAGDNDYINLGARYGLSGENYLSGELSRSTGELLGGAVIAVAARRYKNLLRARS